MSNASTISRLIQPGGSIISSGGEVAVGGGTETYATVNDLPLSGNSEGDQAFVSENDRLYIWTGTGWYNIALINTAPNITSGGAGNYLLAIDGTPTVITLTAEDPEELPITWSYEVTSGSLGSTATIAQADNVFTITPSTNESDAGEFTITFTASDSVNIATDVNSFTLAFSAVKFDYSGDTVQNGGAGATVTWNGSTQNTVVFDSSRTVQNSSGNTFSIQTSSITHGDDFTIEYYYYWTGTDDGYWDSMINIRGTGDTTTHKRVWWQTGNSSWAIGSGSNYTSTGNILAQNSWHHVVFLAGPSIGVKLYRDGSYVSLPHDNDYIYGNSGDDIIFGFGNAIQYFADLEISKGLKYDPNYYTQYFTPPARTTY